MERYDLMLLTCTAFEIEGNASYKDQINQLDIPRF